VYSTDDLGNGIVGYYLGPVLNDVGITDPLTITGVNAALAVWNMIVSLTAGANSERIGRRPMWIISNAGMGFGFCILIGLASG
jgi:MFS family permease